MNEILSVIKKWMTRLLAGIATVLLSVMTLLVLYQVFTRYVLNSRLPLPRSWCVTS